MTKSNFYRGKLLVVVALFLFFCGCPHYFVNQALDDASDSGGYSFDNIISPPGADETFVVLTFSGGGTRAAALAYGVLEKMRDIQLPGKDMSILDEVDVISTVSGGSFTGAYYALFRDRIFSDFKDEFLYRNIERDLMVKLFNPYNWYRLASPYFSRIDLAAEEYNRTIFDSKTYESLARDGRRPYLIVNAANLYQGAVFPFTSDQFRYLWSDLLSYPVARAVAASSAFPFLLSPISLKNYPSPPGLEPSQREKDDLKSYWENKRRYYATYNKVIYRKDIEDHSYVHLMDGGLADNLGLRSVFDMYLREDIRQKINNEAIKRFVVIVVNAKAESPRPIDMKEKAPGVFTVGLKTCTLAMDNYSFETVEVFKQTMEKRIQDQKYRTVCQTLLDEHSTDGFKLTPLAGGNMKLYVIDLSFDNLEDPKERDYFNGIGTSFSLKREQVDNLIKVGGDMLLNHPEFKEFIDEIASTNRSSQ